MTTKVKGEAIKEGSIPFSALATEVKDKIENAGGGADWNAQEGEAGYIENKPFEFIDKHGNAFYYDAVNNPNYIIWDLPSASDCSVIQILDYDGFPQYIFLDDKTDGSLYNMDHIFNTSTFNYKWLENNELGIEIPSYVFDEGEDVRTYLNDLEKYSTGGIVRKISDVYLPNNVLKTTPYTLSNADKNQALANLGIKNYLRNIKDKCTLNIQCDELSFDSERPELVTGYSTGLDNLIKDIKSFLVNCFYYNEIGKLSTEWGKYTCTEIQCNGLNNVDSDNVDVYNITYFYIGFGTTVFDTALFANQFQIRYEDGELLMLHFEI